MVEDPDDASRRLLLHAKNNLAPPPQGLAFRLEQCLVGESIVASRVAWETDPVAITADAALAAEAAGTESRTAKAEAIEFLEAALADGPMPAAELTRMARDHGVTDKPLRSARKPLGVKITRDGFEVSVVIAGGRIDALGAHTCPLRNMGIYGPGGHLWKAERELGP